MKRLHARSQRTAQRTPGLLQAAVLLLPITMAVMGSVVLQPVQGLLKEHFAGIPGNEYWVPFLLTVPAITATGFTVPAGYLADVFGRRPVLIVSMFIYVLVGVGPFFLHDLIPIALCRIGVGLCEGVVLSVTTALLGDYFKGHFRDRLMGTQAAIASTSASLLIPLSGYLGSRIGWNGPFLVYLISALWLAGIVFFTWEPKPDEAVGEIQGGVSWQGFPWSQVIRICALTLVAAYFFYTVQFEVPTALPRYGITNPAVIGSLGGIASWGMVVGAVGFQFVVKRALGQLLLVEFTLIAITFLVMGFSPTPHVLIAAAFFNQIGCGALLPTLLTGSMRLLPFEHRGRGTGIWQGCLASGQFSVGMSFPAITHGLDGNILKTFVLVGAVAVLTSLLTLAGLLFARSRSQAARSPSILN